MGEKGGGGAIIHSGGQSFMAHTMTLTRKVMYKIKVMVGIVNVPGINVMVGIVKECLPLPRLASPCVKECPPLSRPPSAAPASPAPSSPRRQPAPPFPAFTTLQRLLPWVLHRQPTPPCIILTWSGSCMDLPPPLRPHLQGVLHRQPEVAPHIGRDA